MFIMEYVFLLVCLYGLLLINAQSYTVETSSRTSDRTYSLGIDYVGIGYNMLYGNPDGSPTTAAQDPGLRSTHRVFEWTFNKGSTPDQIFYTQSLSCASSKKQELFHNAYAYSSKFQADVSLSVEYGGSGFFNLGNSFRFSKSDYYNKISSSMGSNSYVYYEEQTYCYKGKARLTYELAQVDKYPLDRSFIVRVNRLPVTYTKYDTTYMQFLQDYGTHVVSEVKVGTKHIKRSKWTRSEFALYSAENYAQSTTVGGSYFGFKSSIRVDTNYVKKSMNSGFKSNFDIEEFTLGDEDLSLPYAYTLIDISRMFESIFWSLHYQYIDDGILSPTFYGRLSTIGQNMRKALADYPAYVGSISAKRDATLTVPLTWPLGVYGFPQPYDGCPDTHGFDFHEGYRYQDNEDDKSNSNKWSTGNHLYSAINAPRNLKQEFCMKTKSRVTAYDGDWPSGQYCMFEADNGGCPKGMTEGYIYWDDEDHNNDNTHGGSVPKHVFTKNTRLYYCCNTNGHAENAIFLPTGHPFYLFPYTNNCQRVEGMNYNMEWLYWDDEDDDNDDTEVGSYPYKTGNINHKIYYCYYY